MPSTNNLSTFFQSQMSNPNGGSAKNENSLQPSLLQGDSDKGQSQLFGFSGLNPSQSNAIDSSDLEHFENSTYKLKRTRSVGLLDNFIAPTKKLIEEDFSHANHFATDPLNIIPNQKSLSAKNLNSLNYLMLDDAYADVNDNSNSNGGEDDDDGDDDDDDDDNLNINVLLPKPIPDSRGAGNNAKSGSINNESLASLSQNSVLTGNDSSPSTCSVASDNAGQTEIFQPHDDNDITFEPKNRVDYFSYDWTDREILKSWRYVVDRKRTVDHNARVENSRLENASWRTWARAKYCLKTVTPESINWKKDIDVSWLYGPKCTPETESDVINHLQENKAKFGSSSNPSDPSVVALSNEDIDTIMTNSNNSDPDYNMRGSKFLSTTQSLASLNTNNSALVKPILKQRKISEKINANTDLFKLNIMSERNKFHVKKFFSSPVIETSSNRYDYASLPDHQSSYSVSPTIPPSLEELRGTKSFNDAHLNNREMSPMNLNDNTFHFSADKFSHSLVNDENDHSVSSDDGLSANDGSNNKSDSNNGHNTELDDKITKESNDSVSENKFDSPSSAGQRLLFGAEKDSASSFNSNDDSSTSLSTAGTLIGHTSATSHNEEERGQQTTGLLSPHATGSFSNNGSDGNLSVGFAASESPDKSHLKSSFLAAPATQSEFDAKKSRRIHFNDCVDQCQIVDYYSNSDDENKYLGSDESDDDDDDDDESSGNSDSDSDDEGGFVLKVKANPELQRRLSVNSSLATSNNDFSSLPKIIERLPTAKLRFRDEESSEESEFESEDEGSYPWLSNYQNNNNGNEGYDANNNNNNNDFNNNYFNNNHYNGPYGENVGLGMLGKKNAMSHNVNTNRGYEFYYDYNTVYVPEDLLLNQESSTNMEDVPKDIALNSGFFDGVAQNDNSNHSDNNNISSGTPGKGTLDNEGEGFILTGDEALSLSSEDTGSYSGLSFGNPAPSSRIPMLKNMHNNPSSCASQKNQDNSSINSGNSNANTKGPLGDGSALTKKPSSASNLASTTFGSMTSIEGSNRDSTLLTKHNSSGFAPGPQKPKLSLFADSDSEDSEQSDDESNDEDDEEDFFDFSRRNTHNNSKDNVDKVTPSVGQTPGSSDNIANNSNNTTNQLRSPIRSPPIGEPLKRIASGSSSSIVSDVKVNGYISNPDHVKPNLNKKLSDLSINNADKK